MLSLTTRGNTFSFGVCCADDKPQKNGVFSPENCSLVRQRRIFSARSRRSIYFYCVGGEKEASTHTQFGNIASVSREGHCDVVERHATMQNARLIESHPTIRGFD
jgi:hypothetical protein